MQPGTSAFDQPAESPTARLDPVARAVADQLLPHLLTATGGDATRVLGLWHRLEVRVGVHLADRLASAPTADLLLQAAARAAAAADPGAEQLVAQALERADDPLVRADAQRLLVTMGTWQGDVPRAAAIAAAAADEVRAHDRRRAAILDLDAAISWLHAGEMAAAARAARLAATTTASWPELHATARLGVAWIEAARGERGPRHVLELLDELRTSAPAEAGVGTFAGALLVWLGCHRQARSVLGEVEAVARLEQPAALPFALAALADLDHRAGAWGSGTRAAVEGVQHAAAQRARNLRALLLLRLARFDAAQGRRTECLARLAEADAIGQDAGTRGLAGFTEGVRGLLALAGGDHDAAAGHLHAAHRIARDQGVAHPGIDLHEGDLVEVLARTGQLEAAGAAIDEVDEVGRRVGYPPARAAAARGRLLLCPDDEVEQHGADALAHHDELVMPFDRARTQLVLGERRRRAGDRRRARWPLADALSCFERLGADPWAERARGELRAAGARAPQRRRDGQANPCSLTPQESEVARVVAGGATNQEAADALFLSRKSIERHLTSIYAKLAIRSRADLVRVLAPPGGEVEGFPPVR